MNARNIVLFGALLAGSVVGCKSEKTEPAKAAPAPAAVAAEPLTAEESVLVTATATVQAIDHATRRVTLKDAEGHTTTFTVDKVVRRLDEVKVGDQVTAQYYISVAGELRAPTEEEKQHPLAILEGAARAPKGTDPAGGALRTIRIVTTVQAIDLNANTLTLRGPEGNDATILSKRPENLRKIKVGDTIIVTYTEALAISLDKVAPRK